MNTKMPVIFVGHGSPMNVLLDNSYTRSLQKLATELPRPKAIMVISAHWLTDGTFITCEDKPKQIYDFYGFPDELYDVVYRPSGSEEFALLVEKGLSKDVACKKGWGLDHASWAVLKHMYPEADIPVFEMSLNTDGNEEYHYNLGRKLSFIRENGILIIGSGNIVHNIGRIKYDIDDVPYDWAIEFDEYIRDCLLNDDHKGLLEYKLKGMSAKLAVPTNEHYLPLLYIAALKEKDESIEFFHEGIQNGSMSMRGIKIS